ncbi:MAG: thioredoxin family protein [Candidatus Micrarchaeia archaeon]
MEPVFIEVLTSPNCPHSPRALRVARKIAGRRFGVPIILREVSLATAEGAARAQQFEISATPTIAINGRIAFVGVPQPDELARAVEETIKYQSYRNSYFF